MWQNFLSFWTIFCPFTTLKPQKNQNFEKIKKKPWRYYHFTQVYQKWWSYAILFLRYDTWHVIIFHFGPFFALFPPNNLKNENFKKMKKQLEITSFYTSVPKIMIRWYTVPEIWHMMDGIVTFLFGLFFVLLFLNSPKNQISRKWKKSLDILSFYTCAPQIMIRWCTVMEQWPSG